MIIYIYIHGRQNRLKTFRRALHRWKLLENPNALGDLPAPPGRVERSHRRFAATCFEVRTEGYEKKGKGKSKSSAALKGNSKGKANGIASFSSDFKQATCH